MPTPIRALLLPVLLLLGAVPPAQALTERSGSFTAAAVCEAYQSFRERSNPDAVAVVPGRSYAVTGVDGPSDSWIQIRVPGEDPDLRYVDRVCGRVELDDAAPEGASAELLPLFNDVADGADDPSPQPLPLGAFDIAVLDLCGRFGSLPRQNRFRELLDRPELAADVEEIYESLGQRVTGARSSLDSFKDELARSWFGLDGFATVFCGLLEPSGLRGPHFAGRILELQQQEIAGRLPATACPATAILPPVYAVGMRHVDPATDRVAETCPVTYAYNVSAKELLLEGTRALQSLASNPRESFCVQRVDNGRVIFDALLEIDGTDILSFRPEVAPACPNGLPLRRCLCGAAR